MGRLTRTPENRRVETVGKGYAIAKELIGKREIWQLLWSVGGFPLFTVIENVCLYQDPLIAAIFAILFIEKQSDCT